LARVLIVDDDPQFRRAVRMALTARGHEVSEAANGQEALDKLVARAADIVLLDWRMPVMNGEQSCRAMRAASCVPIIVISALNRENEALSAGATAFFRKPVDVGALLAGIEVHTGAAESTPRRPQT
jgi:two-component system, OmpR family, KDP operon response regulator KdpE